MPAWLLPAISAATSLGGGLLDNLFSRKGQKDANRENKRSEAAQRRFSIDMWNRENQYNHPAQQMARLAESGLNPNLIYGSGVAGAAGNASDVKGYDRYEAKNINEGFNAFANMYQFSNLAAQTDNLRAQVDINKQLAVKAAYDTLNVATDIRKKDFDYGLSTELRDSSVQAARANADTALSNARQAATEADVSESTGSTRVREAQLKVDKLGSEIRNLQKSGRAIDLDNMKRKIENEMKAIELDLNRAGVRGDDHMIFRMLMKNKAVRAVIESILHSGEGF